MDCKNCENEIKEKCKNDKCSCDKSLCEKCHWNLIDRGTPDHGSKDS